MRSLFVYWKTERASLAAAADAMAGFQRELCRRHAGLAARLYRRADDEGEGDAGATLMETYAAPGGIGTELQQCIVADGDLACGGWRRGARHVEVFEDWAD